MSDRLHSFLERVRSAWREARTYAELRVQGDGCITISSRDVLASEAGQAQLAALRALKDERVLETRAAGSVLSLEHPAGSRASRDDD